MQTNNKVMIVAAEASSAAYAVKLLQYWKEHHVPIESFGAGTPEMEEYGFHRIGKSEEMAVVGAAEIISHYSFLKDVFNRLVAEAEKRRPDVVVLMDYPEFNLMLAKQLYLRGLNVVYYISPQVWAWRKGRVNTIRKYCRKVFLLFPFEVDFYKSKGVPYEFVGHPILDDLDPKYYNQEYIDTKRSRMGIGPNDIVLGLMPGSRRLELKNHMGLQIEVARRLYKKFPQLKVVVLVAPTFSKEQVQDELENMRVPFILLKDDPLEMICITDLILAASGTATLQIGLLKKPMVIMYKMQWLTYFFAKIFIRGVKYFGLVNLILNKEVVPERWQAGANADELEKCCENLIRDSNLYRETQKELGTLVQHLGDKGATRRVAEALSEFFIKKDESSCR